MTGRMTGLMIVALVSFGTASGLESEKYLIEAPDLVRILAYAPPGKVDLIDDEYQVQPDGTVLLGEYGNVRVHGLAVTEAAAAISKHLLSKDSFDEPLRVRVDVVTSNSKFYYVIVAADEGEQVHRVALEGRATAASAILEIEGLAAIASKSGAWVARPTDTGKGPKVMELDWKAITNAGQLVSNHSLKAGDRVYVGRSPRK